MKKILLIAAILLGIISQNSFAQKANLNVAVINVDQILISSVAMKKIQDVMSKKESEYQGQIDKKYEALDNDSKKLESRKSVLSQEAFDKEKDVIYKKFGDLKKDLEDKKQSLKKSNVEALAQVDKKIRDIVDQIAKDKNIDLILPSSQTIFYSSDTDISNEVLSKLNKELKEVKVIFN